MSIILHMKVKKTTPHKVVYFTKSPDMRIYFPKSLFKGLPPKELKVEVSIPEN